MKRVCGSLCVPLFACLLACVSNAGAQAQHYPVKPVRLIVPFAAGGGTDIVARTIAQKMSETLAQTVVVDNRGGAGGTIGAETAVRANPDGYTLIMVSASYGANAALYNLPYDPINDVQPISMIGESGFVLILHPLVAAKTVAELITLAKSKPGALNYASTGTGGITHLATELFDLLAGTRMTHVPFKGTGPAIAALLGNQVQVQFGSLPAAIPHVKANRLRGVAVTRNKPSNALPGVPTLGASLKGYEVVIWYGVMGPKGLPREIVNVWSKGIAQALQAKELQERMAGEGLEPAGSTPDQFRSVIRRDVEKWKKVVKEAKVTMQS